MVINAFLLGDPTGNRTPVSRMRTWCPSPLDDGATSSAELYCIISIMSSQTKIALTSIFALSLLSVFSYKSFVAYQPKSIVPIEEVHGTKTEAKIELPAPEESEILGSTISERHKSFNYKSKKSSDAIQQFYKNILFEEKWEINNEGTADIFVNTEYKRERDRVKITTSNQEEQDTIVTIEIWKID